MNLSLHPAKTEDADALVALRIAAMRESLERIGRFDPQRARDRFMATFDPACTWHIVLDDVRVGFVVWRTEPDGLFLNHLYIDPTWQGRGIGAWALRQVLDEADAKRMTVRVAALRDSDSNRFYERHGFVRTHEEPFDIHYRRPAP